MPGPGSYLFGKEEIDEVMDVLETGYISRYGDLDNPAFKQKVFQLEKEYAKYTGIKYCVATSSGTASLMICLLAMGIKLGDEVIVPGYTFIATYSAVIFAGGIPILTEIDESLNIDPIDIEKKITPNTKFIIPVHMIGNPCDMNAIMNIAEKYNLKIIEDACQAAGASYNGKKIGSIGSMGVFSLNIHKTITAGDGGLIVTDDKNLYERAFALHDQGHSPVRAGVEIGHRNILGLNFRINELTGAVALAQLKKLDNILKILREKKSKLKEAIGEVNSMKWKKINDKNGECGTILTAIFDNSALATRIADKLNTKTVDKSGWHVYSNMEHLMEYFKSIDRPLGKDYLPQTNDFLSRSINLSIGVVDGGLGSGFGININSSDDEIYEVANKFKSTTND